MTMPATSEGWARAFAPPSPKPGEGVEPSLRSRQGRCEPCRLAGEGVGPHLDLDKGLAPSPTQSTNFF